MNSKRLTSALIMTLVVVVLVSVVLILTDIFFVKEANLGFLRIFFLSILSGFCLSPFFYWIQARLEEGTIVATRVSDLDLNDRDVREAVDQWVYVHYGKRVDGMMDFHQDESGNLVCHVTVRDDQ